MHSVWHASLWTYHFVGGNELLRQYFQTNHASGNGPGPAALGAHGLADAWTYTKADDDYEVTYWLYGDSEYSTHHKGNDPPATGTMSTVAHITKWRAPTGMASPSG